MFKLTNLLNNLENYFVHKNATQIETTEIENISIDSREDCKNKIFIAEKGFVFDGTKFIETAIKQGATTIIISENSTDNISPEASALIDERQIPVIAVPNTSTTVSELCNMIYSQKPKNIVGITGTNGKTTIAEFTRQIWESLGIKSASLGTIGLTTSEKHKTPRTKELQEFVDDKGLTTMDPLSTHYVLEALSKEGFTHIAMESSSNGLEQHRCDFPFKAGGFSSFETDHLDFHDGLESYFASKKILFKQLISEDGFAVINSDMEDFKDLKTTQDLIDISKDRNLKMIRYGKKGEEIKILFEEIRDEKIYAAIKFFGKEKEFIFPMDNHYMFLSALNAGAFAFATTDKTRADEIIFAIEQLQDVEGRWQQVGTSPKGAKIFIDYAHNGEAIRNILEEGKKKTKISNGKVISIIGGAGGKPKERLQELSHHSTKYSDISILTTDSPRNESPKEIVQKMLEIAPTAKGITNRVEAIQHAIKIANENDIIIICGKGHEKTISINGENYYISDKQAVEYSLGTTLDTNLLKEIDKYNKVINK